MFDSFRLLVVTANNLKPCDESSKDSNVFPSHNCHPNLHLVNRLDSCYHSLESWKT